MSTTRQIMIVEDEPNVRLVFRAALASKDYLLSTAEDGESALRWLMQEPADLILLDLQMPGLGGMETLRKLREAGIETPVVIVSAHDSLPNVVQAMRLGAVDFLPKPTTPASLRQVVADVLARAATSSNPPGGPTTGLISRAKRALNRRALDEADAALRQAIAQDSRCAEGHYLLGIIHEIRDDRRAAHLAALQVNPLYEPVRLHIMKYFVDASM